MNQLAHRREQRCSVWCAIAIALSMTTVGCSGGGDSTPTQPSTPASVSGTWSGTGSDSSGSGTMTWQLSQSGSSFSGSLAIRDGGTGITGRGSVSGTVNGSSLQFSLTIPTGGFDAPYNTCSSVVSGSGTASSTSISGTYSGSTTGACTTGTIASGQLTLNKQ